MSGKARMIAFGAAVLLSGAVAAETMVKEIDVSVDLDDIANRAAAEHFATIDDDLTTALMARLVDRIDEDGLSIEIDLSEVELSNFFEEAFDSAETRLVGQVNVSNESENTGFNSYEMSIRVSDLTPIAAAEASGSTLDESSDAYYAAMIAAFADGVVARLGD